MKYCFILWTRPEIIKLFSLINYCERNNLNYFLIHTNQHYSKNMDKVFFVQLNLKSAKYNLWINWWNHWQMTWKMMIKIEKVLLEEKPDIVFIQWDTNTVLAWWLVASKLWIKVAHVEAWLRSYDRTMPEEINRVVVDHLSDYLFAPTEKPKNILLNEWIKKEKIFVVWNTIVDAVYLVKEFSKKQEKEILNKYWIEKENYILLTTHRPSNVDNKENLKNLLEWIIEIKKLSNKKILFPIHPRTRNNIKNFWLIDLLKEFIVIEPVWFFENIILEDNAYLITTDSWWIQEEACILEKKTLILRENTERPETLDVWWAILVWNNKGKIISTYKELEDKKINWYNPFWDWKSSERIFDRIKNW